MYQAIPVKAGTHQISLKYRTPGLTAGTVISLLCLIACVILIWQEHRGNVDSGKEKE
jgi:uncharacterized membrane protein YfhO